MARLHMRGLLCHTTQQLLRLYVLLVRALDLWALSGKGKQKAGKMYIHVGSLFWMHDVQCILKLFSRSNCVSNPSFLEADASLPVAFEDPQQTLCMPAKMDRNNFAAICKLK